ncbi:hypothetical protein KLP28_02660 [Nocardioidaceae bacterium]|nr:hypothetical protein KLP28_02660 [Nocardioidaceae bacterium]
MGWLDALRGRRTPPAPRLDALFSVPGAAVTLEVEGWKPTGTGGVCYRATDGRAFAELQADVRALLDADDGPPVEVTRDEFGFTWLVVTGAPDVGAVVTDLHAVNVNLAEHGFDSGLLCTTIGFSDGRGGRLALVYLYKQGTFYPFVPSQGSGGRQRDNLAELRVRDLVAGDVPFETDLNRWMALYDAPGF